jgi:hypothetical protein
MRFSRLVIPEAKVASLTWCGDALVDWVSGGAIFHLDGRRQESRLSWGFPFDAACATGDGQYAVLYQRTGTKGLLLRGGKIVRELNRSYYHAHVYEYPICIWRVADGRTLIAHCPEEYCRIDIEDAESGARLTQGTRKPQDFFHSRLMVNGAGNRLLSAGWIWHPWNSVCYFDIREALRDPARLDKVDDKAPGSFHIGLAEHASACWQTNERVLLGGSSEEEDRIEVAETNAPELRLRPAGIAVYDVVSRSYISSVVPDELPGTMMPLGESHAVCFYKHPRVVSLDSGETIARWEELDTGKQVSSIIWSTKLPPLAIDVAKHRFAVAGPDNITVVQVDLVDSA